MSNFFKLIGLLMFILLAVGCSSSDDDNEKESKWYGLIITTKHSLDESHLKGIKVQVKQNGIVLIEEETDGWGEVHCYSNTDDLQPGKATITATGDGYQQQTVAVDITEEEYTRLDIKMHPLSGITVTTKNIEDFTATMEIDMDPGVEHVKVYEGSSINDKDYDTYTNNGYPYSGLLQNINFTRCNPATTYTYTVVAYDGSDNMITKKTVTFTTTDWNPEHKNQYATLDVKSTLSIADGIAAKYTYTSNVSDVYVACYEATKAPSSEVKIITDAMKASNKIGNTGYAYVSKLKPSTKYRLYIFPITENNWPGELSYVDITTKSASDLAAATVYDFSWDNSNDISYKFKSSYYGSGKNTSCLSFRGVQVSNYNDLEAEPDIAWAIVCQEKTLVQFESTYSSRLSSYDLSLSQWYAIISMGYKDSSGKNNSGIISRYKFRYGTEGEYTGANQVPAKELNSSSKMIYGAVSKEMIENAILIQ